MRRRGVVEARASDWVVWKGEMGVGVGENV